MTIRAVSRVFPERKAIKPLIEFIKRREETKAAHKKLTNELKEMNEVESVQLFQQHREHFEETETSYIYASGPWELDMVKGDLKCKTKIIDDEE